MSKNKYSDAIQEGVPKADDVYNVTPPKEIELPKRRDSDDLGVAVIGTTGLTFKGELSPEQWLELGIKLRERTDKLQWSIGDWIRYGDAKWGEIYYQAEQVTGYAYRTLIRFKNVAEFYDNQLFLRRNNLTFTHHAVAYEEFPKELVNTCLDDAEALGWSVKQMREQMKPEQLPSGSEEKHSAHYRRHERYMSRFTAYQYNRMSDEERIQIRIDLKFALKQMDKWERS